MPNPTTAEKGKHITARVPQDVFQALDGLARENDRTLSGEVRQALRSWVDPESIRDRNGGK